MKILRQKDVQNQGLQGGIKKFWHRFGLTQINAIKLLTPRKVFFNQLIAYCYLSSIVYNMNIYISDTGLLSIFPANPLFSIKKKYIGDRNLIFFAK